LGFSKNNNKASAPHCDPTGERAAPAVMKTQNCVILNGKVLSSLSWLLLKILDYFENRKVFAAWQAMTTTFWYSMRE
jgi:hypothetical protein